MPTTKPSPQRSSGGGQYTASASGNFFSLPDPNDFLGTGGEEELEKLRSKSARELAELQGKIQKQLQEQQYQYQLQIQAQAQAASLQQQIQGQQFQTPFMTAELTGSLNGTETLASRQLGQQQSQFEQNLALERLGLEGQQALGWSTLGVQAEIQRRQASLAELNSAHDRAIAEGNFQLAQEIERRSMALQEDTARVQEEIARAEQSGYLANGQLTEAGRAARAREAIERGNVTGVYVDPTTGERMTTQQAQEFAATHGLNTAQVMGVNAQGQLTDAAQQWRTNAALEAARTSAALSQNAGDYFESAAYLRSGDVQDTLGFLGDPRINAGFSSGFRTAGGALPSTSSLANLATGGEGPSPSLTQAQAASATGAPAAYTTAMHQAPALQNALGAAQQQIAAQPFAEGPRAPTQQQVAQYGQEAAGRLANIQPIFQAGAHKLAPGALESMTPTERGLFSSAAKASGIRPEDFEQQYKRSRLQTNVSATAL